MRFLTKFLVCKVFLYKCFYEHEHCLEETTCFIPSPIAPAKITSSLNFFCNISTNTFWKVLRHINAYVSNKWPLKFPRAYLNTQGSCTTGTPLIRIQGG
ncbi:hypothetical protein T06_261 [Trichinella sp. T6]|nr:hypothetical protein T06_261 [Trichinella sp. T6]